MGGSKIYLNFWYPAGFLVSGQPDLVQAVGGVSNGKSGFLNQGATAGKENICLYRRV